MSLNSISATLFMQARKQQTSLNDNSGLQVGASAPTVGSLLPLSLITSSYWSSVDQAQLPNMVHWWHSQLLICYEDTVPILLSQAFRYGRSLLPGVRSHQLLVFLIMRLSTFQHRNAHRFFLPLHYSWRFGLFKVLGVREDTVYIFLILFAQSGDLSCSSFTCQHSTLITAQLLWARRPCTADWTRGPRHSCFLRLADLHPSLKLHLGPSSIWQRRDSFSSGSWGRCCVAHHHHSYGHVW